jgi:hypothetical protein
MMRANAFSNTILMKNDADLYFIITINNVLSIAAKSQSCTELTRLHRNTKLSKNHHFMSQMIKSVAVMKITCYTCLPLESRPVSNTMEAILN